MTEGQLASTGDPDTPATAGNYGWPSMGDSAEQVKAALLDAVVELAERRAQGEVGLVDGVVLRHYFAQTAPQDLADKGPIDLYAATMRHFQLAEQRPPSDTLIRIYNPVSDDDGWTSSHTVIDLVSEDMPFIVDSVLALLERLGYQIHVLAHPMFSIDRSHGDQLVGVSVPGRDDPMESLLHIEIDRITAAEEIEDLELQVRNVLGDVRAAVQDWTAMRAKALEIADELDRWQDEADTDHPRYVADIGEEPREIAALLRYMESDAFTFIGYREYLFTDDPDGPLVSSRPETGLGTLRQSEATVRNLGELPPETAELSRRPSVLNLTKANTVSTVHRPVPLDYVGIKAIDADGRVIGERRFLGLFTSRVYSGRVEDIPTIRQKVAEVIGRADFHSTSHDYNRLLNTLQLYPRDELFQMNVDDIERMAMALLDLRDRRQVSMLMRRDDYGRFLSCLVFVPRDRHSTELRLKIQETLMEVYRGRSIRFSTEISDAPLARLHIVIYTDPTPAGQLPDLEAVEARLRQVTRTWDDYLRESLIDTHGEDAGLDLLGKYGQAFDAAYRENVLAESAVHDIERLEALADGDIDIALHRPLEAGRCELRCKIYRAGDPILLSQMIPMLHDLGAVVIDERPYEVRPDGDQAHFVYDLGLEMPLELDRDARARVRGALLAVWQGRAESDGLAELAVVAGLGWREITVLRAYSRYLLQIGTRFSFRYIVDTLVANPEIAAQLAQVFRIRFDPQLASNDASPAADAVRSAIDSVASLDHDRILRQLLTVMMATVRTNHWQFDPDGGPRPALAIKLRPSSIPDLPKPAPAAEIFVYSPRTEGVHLRSGRVARGGLRWSERMEDYRTEILGLMKAQTVKNSVIVPVGAKGGFVARHLPGPGSTREQVGAEVIACYRTFVGAMLDVTDNVDDDRLVAPDQVVRHDDDDPYLVVAADKGTATFSDTANAIAIERGFWLDDAFASGGSAGYDHKALAITARGAWVSVERHFHELGIDPTTMPFTAIGVGDMSGDVFGNGLLRSDQTRLIAAFDHRHVFVDPDPDPAASFTERRRLYKLDRSSWADYDTGLISDGGGVFPRDLKSISVTAPMRASLGISDDVDELTPDQLIRAVLMAPVDLLWNGGIGTYVKASTETDADVGDRANDALRVDATELRCRVVGEGGNLGVTQRGRIEFATRGGRINTDAIDNSGGVDCSDHEVNLKILLAMAERNGDMTRKQRNVLLESMADDVCRHVLLTNDAQNETLSAAEAKATGMIAVHERVMQWLEDLAHLDRGVEALPSTQDMRERREAGVGLTRPELAVLLAYTKNAITEALVRADLTGNGEFDDLLLAYFPPEIRRDHADLIRTHPLHTELTAMLLSNHLVNRGGISMVPRLIEETSATVSDIALAHIAAWRIYDLDDLWDQVNEFDFVVPAATAIALDQDMTRLGERATRWLLRNEPQPLDVVDVVARYQPAVRALQERADGIEQPDGIARNIERFTGDGVPPELAVRIATLGPAYGFLDLSTVAARTGADLGVVAELHGEIGDQLDLNTLREWIVALPRDDRWQTMARGALRDQYVLEHAQLTAVVLESMSVALGPGGRSAGSCVRSWIDANAVATRRCRRTFAEIESIGDLDLSHVSVAVRALSQLRHTS